MKRILATRPHRLGLTLLAIGAAVFTVAAAQAATSSRSHHQSAGWQLDWSQTTAIPNDQALLIRALKATR
jgi:hypothetical protein